MIYKNKSVILIKNKRNKYSLIYPIRVYIRIFVAHIYELANIQQHQNEKILFTTCPYTCIRGKYCSEHRSAGRHNSKQLI